MSLVSVYKQNRPFFGSIDVKSIVYKMDAGWINCHTRIMPIPEKQFKSDCLIKTENLMVLSETFKLDEFTKLLDDLSNGEVEICNVKVKFGKIEIPKYVNRQSSQRAKNRFRMGYPIQYCAITHSSISFPLHNIDSELLNLDKPYPSLDDLVKDVLEFESWSIDRNSIYIIIPMYLRIRECSFKENQLIFSVDFHSKMKNNVSIGLIYKNRQGKQESSSWDLKKDKIQRDDIFCTYDDVYEVNNEDIVSAKIILRSGISGIIDETDEILRLKPPDKMKIFEEFWTEDKLLNCLKGKDKKREDGFEWGVNTLFSLCGFEVLWVGWFKGNTSLGGADLLIFHNNTIWVIECTIGSIGNDKIDRLLHAIKTIKDTLGLQELNQDQKIIPMIFSSREISDKTKGDANKVGVKIKDIDDIIKIFNLMKRKTPIEKIITFLESDEGVSGFVHLYP